MSLDRLSILSLKHELPREPLNVPEWGGIVYVRTLSAFERDSLEMSWDATKRRNFRARLAVATVCDENGKDLFELRDIETLGNHPSPALVRVGDLAMKLNKLTSEDVADLEKNSETGPSDASSSA